jgi:hypothetical protein
MCTMLALQPEFSCYLAIFTGNQYFHLANLYYVQSPV